jgi:hypothetical protein
MVNSSFQTENLPLVRTEQLDKLHWHTLLNVFWQARHEVLSVFVQRFALFLVLVGRVYDGGFELALGIAGCILRLWSDPTA